MKDALKSKGYTVPDVKMTGKYIFEDIDGDGNVVGEPTTIHNDPTEFLAERQKIINNYYNICGVAAKMSHVVPGAIALYNDPTPVNLKAGAEPTGDLVGFIDFTSPNPNAANIIEGYRLETECTTETIDDTTQRLTYRGEFASVSAIGTVNKVRMWGIDQYLIGDGAKRSSTTDNDWGIKELSLTGGQPLTSICPINSSKLGAIQEVTHQLITPEGFVWNDGATSNGFGRAALALSSITDDRHAILDFGLTDYSTPEVTIMPITKYKYGLMAHMQMENVTGKAPIATLTMATKTNNVYTGCASFFYDRNYYVITRDGDDIVVDLYDKDAAYALTSTRTITLPKLDEWGSEFTCFASAARDGVLTIAEYPSLMSTSASESVHAKKEARCFAVDIDTFVFVKSPTNINTRNMHAFSLEMQTSYPQYRFTDCVWDEASGGFFFYGWHHYTSRWMEDYGVFWLRDTPVPDDKARDFVGVGKAWGDYDRGELYDPYWYNRGEAARSLGETRTFNLAMPSRSASDYQDFLSEYRARVCWDKKIGFVVGNSQFCAMFPFTVFKNSVLTETVTDVVKNGDLGLRVTYILDITETSA